MSKEKNAAAQALGRLGGLAGRGKRKPGSGFGGMAPARAAELRARAADKRRKSRDKNL